MLALALERVFRGEDIGSAGDRVEQEILLVEEVIARTVEVGGVKLCIGAPLAPIVVSGDEWRDAACQAR